MLISERTISTGGNTTEDAPYIKEKFFLLIFENLIFLEINDTNGVQAITAIIMKIRLPFKSVIVSKSDAEFLLRQNIPLRTADITDIFSNLKSTQPK